MLASANRDHEGIYEIDRLLKSQIKPLVKTGTNMMCTRALIPYFPLFITLIMGVNDLSFGQADSAEGPVEFKLKQVHVNGLLVMPLVSGKEAGSVSRMNATVVSGGGTLRFNQDVGMAMSTALNEVQKYMTVRHPVLPSSSDLELAFEEKYSEKDGPSAAVACALLMEAALTGKTWDPTFAVTGDMNADGTVQPIGSVAAKIRGASNAALRVSWSRYLRKMSQRCQM